MPLLYRQNNRISGHVFLLPNNVSITVFSGGWGRIWSSNRYNPMFQLENGEVGNVSRHEHETSTMRSRSRGWEACCGGRSDAWWLFARYHRNVWSAQPEMVWSSQHALHAIRLWCLRNKFTNVSLWWQREVENEGVFKPAWLVWPDDAYLGNPSKYGTP